MNTFAWNLQILPAWRPAALILLLAALISQPVQAQVVQERVVKQSGRWHEVPSAQPGGAATSVTTGWRTINGWEQGLLQKDPTLVHWGWYGMQEATKAYKHWAPGTTIELRKQQRVSHYLKPKHIPTAVEPTSHPPTSVAQAHPNPGGHYIKPHALPLAEAGPRHYVKPNHVPTVIPPPVETNTAISLGSTKTSLVLRLPPKQPDFDARAVHALLKPPGPSVEQRQSGKLGPPVPVVGQNVTGKLSPSVPVAARNASAKLQPPATVPVPMKTPEPAADSDDFSNPDPYAHNPYGRVVVSSGGKGSHARAGIRGKLLRKSAVR